MWLIYILISIIMLSISIVFFKIGNKNDDKYSILKTIMMLGFVMGIHAIIYGIVNKLTIDYILLIKSLPIFLCFIVSMYYSIKNIKENNLLTFILIGPLMSIILLIIIYLIFKVNMTNMTILSILIILIGSLLLLLEFINKNIDVDNKEKMFISYGLLILSLIINMLFVKKFEILSINMSLFYLELECLIISVIIFMYLVFIKKEKIKTIKEYDKVFGSLFFTIGNYYYVLSYNYNYVLSLFMLSTISILLFLLSKSIFKDKTNLLQLFSIIIILIGIIIMVYVEVN